MIYLLLITNLWRLKYTPYTLYVQQAKASKHPMFSCLSIDNENKYSVNYE